MKKGGTNALPSHQFYQAITSAYEEEGARQQPVAAGAEGQQQDEEGQSDVESVAESTASSEAIGGGRPKLAVLSNSLAAITKEKAQNEAKFAADKRKLRKEKEELAAELALLRKSNDGLKGSLEETKSKLIIEKHERETEMNNNKLMMKELQKVGKLADCAESFLRRAAELGVWGLWLSKLGTFGIFEVFH